MEILRKYFYTNLILVLLFTNCVEKAKIKLPAPEEKLVVTCFIGAGDNFINASVRTSAPEFSATNYTNVANGSYTNATVVFGDGLKSLTIPFDTSAQLYFSVLADLKIQSGKTYYLSVKTKDGKSILASTTVPLEKLEFESVKTGTIPNSSIGSLDVLNITITDVANKTNYISCFFQSGTIKNNALPNVPAILDTTFYETYTGLFDTDEFNEKKNYQFSNTTSHFLQDSIIGYLMKVTSLNCSKEFYEYNKSVQSSYNSGGGNPFSQPSLIYSNIPNGFGCFGAYNSNSIIKKIN